MVDCSAILVRQCNFQNLVLFRPNRPLEHRKTLRITESRIADKVADLGGGGVRGFNLSVSLSQAQPQTIGV